MDVILEARNLTKSYDGKTVVEGLNFSVFRNECFGLVGPNDSGKSTVLELLNGGSFLSSGDYFVEGMNGRKNQSRIQKKLGVMSPKSSLDPELSVIDNLIMYARYFSISHKKAVAKARDLLRFIRLEENDNQPIGGLSDFAKSRLRLAMAIVNDPDILFLDEPTTGMDPSESSWMWNAIDHLKINGMTIVLATTHMQEAERLCERIIILDHGKALCEGTPDGLIDEIIGQEVIEFQVDLADLEYHLKKVKDHYKYQVLNNRIRLFLRDSGQTRDALNLVISDSIQVRRASLDDVFLKMAGYDLQPRA